MDSTIHAQNQVASRFVQVLGMIQLALVPVLALCIYLIRGRQPLPDNTQLWWIPVIQAQLNLVVIATAFSSATVIRRFAMLVFGTCYVVSMYFAAKGVLYQNWSIPNISMTEHVKKTAPGMILTVLACSVLVIPSRFIFGFCKRDWRQTQKDRRGIADLLMATLVLAVGFAIYRSYISTLVDMDFDRLNSTPVRLSIYSLRAGACIGLALLILSRRHSIAGLALFASTVTLNATLHATVLPARFELLMSVYCWGVVFCTLLAVRIAGYTLKRGEIRVDGAGG